MHLSMKLFDMFDQTPPHTLDKIMAKLVLMKMLDLQHKGQGHSKKQKIITSKQKHATSKKLSTDSLSK